MDAPVSVDTGASIATVLTQLHTKVTLYQTEEQK